MKMENGSAQNSKTHHKKFILVILYISYILYIYVRRSFSFAIPSVVETTGLEKNDLGKPFHLSFKQPNYKKKLVRYQVSQSI